MNRWIVIAVPVVIAAFAGLLAWLDRRREYRVPDTVQDLESVNKYVEKALQAMLKYGATATSLAKALTVGDRSVVANSHELSDWVIGDLNGISVRQQEALTVLCQIYHAFERHPGRYPNPWLALFEVVDSLSGLTPADYLRGGCYEKLREWAARLHEMPTAVH
ncbi:MAG TPA: hypothetical protein VI322_03975 [Candidatus Saccharimonadia bacterium]